MSENLEPQIITQEFYRRGGIIKVSYQPGKDIEELCIDFQGDNKGMLIRKGKELSGFMEDVCLGTKNEALFRERLGEIKNYLVTALTIPGARQMIIDYK